MKVKCPGCCEVYLETTDTFDPDKVPNGTMFRLRPEYGPNGYNWTAFPHDEWIIGGALECPGCGSPIAGMDGRKVMVVGECDIDDKTNATSVSDVHVCPDCGKGYTAKSSLDRHMTKHHFGS